MEPNHRNESLAADEVAPLDTRLHIRVISYRKRRHDPEGVSVKAVLDGLVRIGLLPDDSTDYIAEITFESRIAKEEKTLIQINNYST